MDIKKLRSGDYATYIHAKTTWVACMSDNAGSFKEAVSIPKAEIEKNGNLYTFNALGDDIDGTLRESSGSEIKFYEKTLADYEKSHPEIYETPKPELKGVKVVGHLNLDEIPKNNHPAPATKEEKQERRDNLSRQEKFGITGYSPKNREVVLFKKKFSNESCERSNIAIAYDENHFYVACGLYGDYNSFTTIFDPHPDGLQPGTFPRGTVLFQVTPGMGAVMIASDGILAKYKDDMDKYDALIKQRELEEKQKKEEEERIKQLKEEHRQQLNVCPEPDEKLLNIICGNEEPTIDYPLVSERSDFVSKLTGLSRFYYEIADKPKVYSLSPSYQEQMIENFKANIDSVENKKKLLEKSSAVICVKPDGHILTIPFRITSETLRFSVIRDGFLFVDSIYAYDKKNFDFVMSNQWRSSKNTAKKLTSFGNTILQIVLAFLYDQYSTLVSINETSADSKEMAERKWNFLYPQMGEYYVKRTIQSK